MFFSKDKPSRILIVASNATDQVLSKREFINAILVSNHLCTIVSPDEFVLPGIKHKVIRMNKRGMNVFSDLIYFVKLFYHILRNRPDVAIFFALKPRLYGSIICFILRQKFVLYVNGMGNLYLSEQPSIVTRFIRGISEIFLKGASLIIVQNTDDKQYICQLVNPQKVKLLPGSGVNVDYYKPQECEKLYDFVMVSRLIADKGVIEFLTVARNLADKGYKFLLVGQLEENSLITEELLHDYASPNLTVITEHTSTFEMLSVSRFAVLPSLREGCSRFLLEALAMGVPILTTNAPGCRDFFRIHKLGRLFSPRSASALQKCILELANFDYEGQSILSREVATDHFSSADINRTLYEIIEGVLDI